MAVCKVCFRQCELKQGQVGFCGARICEGGSVVAKNYGKVCSVALDPIEKKPLYRFFPGSKIISVGSCGCNLRCPFCQNHEISWSGEAMKLGDRLGILSPQELLQIAERYKSKGNIGVAYTYNEPLVCYEYVRDCARLIRDAGMKNVLVTNGCAQTGVLDELSDCIDAMNIDLKCFDEKTYRNTLGGDLGMVLDFIASAVKSCHVELTTLVVPGISDDAQQLEAMVDHIAQLTDADGKTIGQNIPLHLTRYFPRFRMTDRPATDIALIHKLADVARRQLSYVSIGNCCEGRMHTLRHTFLRFASELDYLFYRDDAAWFPDDHIH